MSNRKKKILNDVPQAESNAEVLSMCDKEEELAFVVVDIKHSIIRMLKMQLSTGKLEDPQNAFIVDSLMRATASYGANYGAYRLQSQIPEIEYILTPLGFQKEGEFLVIDMKHLVHIISPK